MQCITRTERAFVAFYRKLVGLCEKEWHRVPAMQEREVLLGVTVGLNFFI